VLAVFIIRVIIAQKTAILKNDAVFGYDCVGTGQRSSLITDLHVVTTERNDQRLEGFLFNG
jgi:hypothetical protein